MAERCAAVGHIEREGDVLGKHLVHAVHHGLGGTRLMACSPFVEPSAPELRAHQRGIGAQLFQALELLVDVGTCAEVHGPYQVVESVLREVTGPVALEEKPTPGPSRGEGRECFAYDVADFRDVGLVLTIRTVLVFHLHHDDGAAALDGQRCKLFAHFLFEDFHALHEIGILLAQTDVLLLEQPPWQSAHFPLGTDVWTGAHDDIHAVFLCQTAEFCHVVLACEIEFSLRLFMDIPENVDTHGIHAQRLAHLDAVVPIGARDARIVDFGSLHHERLAVEQEGLVARGEGMCGWLVAPGLKAQ